MTSFPGSRLRRLRGNESIRNMARETRLSAKEFIYPMFVAHGHGVKELLGSIRAHGRGLGGRTDQSFFHRLVFPQVV